MSASKKQFKDWEPKLDVEGDGPVESKPEPKVEAPKESAPRGRGGRYIIKDGVRICIRPATKGG